MTDLQCDVRNCANNKDCYCCRPDITVSGPRAGESDQTYCASFIDHEADAPSNAVYDEKPNPRMDIRCDVGQCTYNDERYCNADHIDIKTTKVNSGQIKTECATFENREDY